MHFLPSICLTHFTTANFLQHNFQFPISYIQPRIPKTSNSKPQPRPRPQPQVNCKIINFFLPKKKETSLMMETKSGANQYPMRILGETSQNPNPRKFYVTLTNYYVITKFFLEFQKKNK